MRVNLLIIEHAPKIANKINKNDVQTHTLHTKERRSYRVKNTYNTQELTVDP